MSRKTTMMGIISGFFRIRLQCFLAVLFLLIISLPVRAADGGTLYPVGGDFGWQYTDGTFNYQGWASSINFTVNDTLDFGLANPEYQVMLVPSPAAGNCNPNNGRPIRAESRNNDIEYRFRNPGEFGFMNPKKTYCDKGMQFTVNVVQSPPPEPVGAVPVVTPNNELNESATTSKLSKKTGVGWIVGVVMGAVVVLVLMALLVLTKRGSWGRLMKKSNPKAVLLSYMSSDSRTYSRSSHTKGVDSGDVEWPWGPQRFSYKELKEATDNFNSALVIGEGGFGTVYKGYLGNLHGAPVAVKRLSQYARQGAREFMAELNIISQLRHRNLVHLVGWCDEKEELILVYEYMPNGDLDDLIFGSCHGDDGAIFTPLSWECRYKTFVGVATALVYLHEEWEQRVVHRDVKTSNVMLDSQFNARLGDFGLARLSAHSQAPRTTLIAGTIGYLAPEFNLTGRATDKTDVYAYGVVILEVCCARRPLTSNCILVDWVWDLHKDGKLLDAIDPKLDAGSISDEEVKLALHVGLLCSHPDPGTRPSMRHVLNILTGETPVPKIPRSKPVAVFAEDR